MATERDPLRRHLEEEWRKRVAARQPTLAELLTLDIIDDMGMFGDFVLLAEACEEVWRKPTAPPGAARHAGVNFVDVSKTVAERFKAFRDYLHKAMKTPLDFFRFLRLASRPTEPARRKNCKWNNVWEELYLLVVVCGRQKALHPAWAKGWANLPTIDAHAALRAAAAPPKVAKAVAEAAVEAAAGEGSPRPRKGRSWDRYAQFLPTSGDWGFHPDDAQFIYAPLMGPGAAYPNRKPALLRARLWLHQAGASGLFDKAQDLRRIAVIYAMFRGLVLLDELQVVDLSERVLAATTADPLVVNRVWWEGKSTKYHIGSGEQDLFTVVWIEEVRAADGEPPSVHIEMPAFPGQLFKTYTSGSLASLAQDDVARRVAESLNSVVTLAIAYLIVLGFAFDIITAGAASAGLRGLLMAYLREKVTEAVIDKGLEAANITNPAFNFIVQMGAGAFAAGRRKDLLDAGDIDRAKGDALSFGGKSAKPRTPRKPPRPHGSPQPEPTRPRAPTAPAASKPQVVPYERSKAPPLSATAQEQLDRQDAWMYAEEDGLLERAARKVGELADAGAQLLDSSRLVGEGHRGLGSLTFHTAGSAKGAGAALVAGGKGASKATSPTKSKAASLVTKFESSPAYRVLSDRQGYMDDGEYQKLLGVRQDIRTRLGKGPPHGLTLKEANKELRNRVVNKAKDQTGEAIAESIVRSEPYPVKDTLAIPRRGTEGPPMLDLVAEHEPNPDFDFTVVEAKGGLRTRLGPGVQRARLQYKGAELVEQGFAGYARQASGEWHYRKFAEVFLSGQKLAAAAKASGNKKLAQEAQRQMTMAIRFVEAARKGRVRFVIVKSSPTDDEFFHLVEAGTNWFTRPFKKTKPGEFPIPESMGK